MTELAPAAPPFQRYGWVLVCVLPVAAALVVRGPMPVDETRYLSVAWEMWSKGNFVVPALNGEPYTHKPPMLFWLMHIGWWLFGVNDRWPRLIPLFAALASVWLARRLASDLYPEPGVPDTAAWLLAGTLAWTVYSTVLLFDLVLVVCVLVAIVALERVERAPLGSWGMYAAALAAGLLTKGPVMLVFTLAPALLGPWWSTAANRLPLRWYGGLVASLMVALAAAGLWVLAAYEEAGTAFVYAILWEQSAMRIVRSFSHARPWWFYLGVFPCMLLPWLLWPTAWRVLCTRAEQRADRLVLAILAPAFVIFSLISGKQPHYLLALVPMVVLWLAPRVSPPALRLSGAALVGLVFMVLGAGIAVSAVWYEPVQPRIVTGLAVMAGGVLFLLCGANQHAVIRRMAFASAMTSALITLAFFSTMGEIYRLNAPAAMLRSFEDQGLPIAWIGSYGGQLNFLARLTHPVAELDAERPDQILEWVAAHPDGQVVIHSRRGRDYGPELHRMRYRSGWLAIIPASAPDLVARIEGQR